MAKLKFNVQEVKRVVKAGAGKVILVHDSGVYLMPNRNGPAGDDIAYAKGCDPKKDKDWYDTAHFLVGGDDFGEYLELDPATVDSWKEFQIELTTTQLAVLFK